MGKYVNIEDVKRIISQYHHSPIMDMEIDSLQPEDVAPVKSSKCLMLPCRIGDIVYDCDFGTVNEWKIVGFSVGKVGLGMNGLYSDDCEIIFYAESTERQAQMEFPQSSIGDDVFLTREEAQRDLEG